MLLACLVVMLVVLSAASVYMLRKEPEWFQRPVMTEQVRSEAVARAQTQLSRITDLASSLRAYEARRQKAIREGTTLPADELPKPLTVLLTEDELNAVFQTYAHQRGWDREFDQLVADPVIVLQKDRVILAGKISELNIAASVYFGVGIDDKGQLRADMMRVLGGKLPLPDVVLEKYRGKVVQQLMNRLPIMQRQAKIDVRGVPNDSTVQASLTKLMLQSIKHEAAEPVFFLPVLTAKGTVPVKLTDMQISDGQLQMTLGPMSEVERDEMLARLKSPYPAPAQVDPAP